MKKVPLRMCVGCQEMKPKKQLLRIVRTADNKVCVDLTGKMPGRGAYICPEEECLNRAQKQKRLQKAFEGAIDEKEVFERLRKELVSFNDK